MPTVLSPTWQFKVSGAHSTRPGFRVAKEGRNKEEREKSEEMPELALVELLAGLLVERFVDAL